MKILYLLFFSACLIASCRVSRSVSNTSPKGLDTITDLDLLPLKTRAVYKTEQGEYLVMRYEADFSDSIQENIDTSIAAMRVPGIAKIRTMGVATARVNRRCDSDYFDGSYRWEAKISKSDASLQTYNTLHSFMNTLENDDNMANHSTPITTNSARVPEENRNVRLKTAFLYCYSRQTDEDFHLIIGTTQNSTTAIYFNVEVSGLPNDDDDTFSAIQRVRENFLIKAQQRLCSSGYYFFDTPKKIELKGSLFFDKEHYNEDIGPASARPLTAWEIHPVTYFKYK